MNDVIRLASGVHQDSSKYEQPKGSYLFALNAILDADGYVGNENSIKEVTHLPENMCVIGKVYIGDEDIALFLASDDMSKSEIGIFNTKTDTYTTYVTDEDSPSKLNFRKTHQIDAVYRLRRGCERTVYFTDNLNKPRKYCFDRPEKFKTDGVLDASLFDLQRTHKSIPHMDFEVLENGGSLKSGSYQIGIQYLDHDKNAGEWMTLSKPIYIYVDSLDNSYQKIEGSIHTIGSDSEYQSYPSSNKGIKVSLSNVDKSYPFYRLCIAEYNNGHGGLTKLRTTSIISTETDSYTYTGENHEGEISKEEINLFRNIIDKAKNIAQLDNKLFLSNLEGKQINYCGLQKYASRIVTDCIISDDIPATDVRDQGNSKNPTNEVYLKGYTPGEIYSFGIVYLFEDNRTSPVFHIPGRVEPFDPRGGYYPNTRSMESYLNKNTKYIEHNTCDSNYWGQDHLGNVLSNTAVRHHKFPTREQLGIPFISQEVVQAERLIDKKYIVRVEGDRPFFELKSKFKIYADEVSKQYDYVEHIDFEVIVTSPDKADLYFKEAPQTKELDKAVTRSLIADNRFIPETEFQPESTFTITGNKVTTLYRTVVTGIKKGDSISSTTYEYYDNVVSRSRIISGKIRSRREGTEHMFKDLTFKPKYEDLGRQLKQIPDRLDTTYNVLGVKFSNIILPDEDFIGEKIIGFYIVRQECTQEDSIVLDSAVLLPVTQSEKNKQFFAHGLLSPEYESTLKNNMISTKMFAFVSPQHKFNQIQNKNFDRIVYHGSFLCKSRGKIRSNYDTTVWEDREKYYGWVVRNDVMDGSSISGVDGVSDQMDDSKKKDGWSLCLASRSINTRYVSRNTIVISRTSDIKVDYLSTLDYCIKNEKDEPFYYNLSGDNKIGFLRLDKEYFTEQLDDTTYLAGGNSYPYVTFERDVEDPYGNFTTRSYFLEHHNPIYFSDSSTIDLFSGDSNVASMVYNSSCFIGNQLATVSTKNKSIWYYVGAGAILLAGVLGSVFTGGSSLIIAGGIISTLAASAFMVASGLKYDALQRALNGHYNEGLKECLRDDMVNFWFYKDEDINKIDGDLGKQPRGTDKLPLNNNRFREKMEKVYSSFFYSRDKTSVGDNGLSDDAICWVTESINNLWFETKVPVQLRSRMTNNLPSFVPSPTDIERGNDYNVHYTMIDQDAGEDNDYLDISKDRDPVSNTEQHAFSKLLTFDPNKNKFQYNGFIFGEYYFINPDYSSFSRIKVYDHIALEYDCCSGCNEKFPHRWTWSNTSFEEEREDNYSIFLPNNYKDIPGNTGQINNMFVLNGELFLHTEESLWNQPRGYQERVNNDIVSYIGDGSFALPPRELHQNINGSSAGLEYKFSSMLSKFGYFFVNLREHTVYHFSGQIQNLSTGLTKYFNEHISDLGNKYRDNHANEIGNGFHFGYDELNDRVLMTLYQFVLHDSKDHIYNGYVFDDWDDLSNNLYAKGYKFNKYLNIDGTLKAEFIKFTTYPSQNKSDILSKDKVYLYPTRKRLQDLGYRKGYTMSFSMRHHTWSSWHSYIPNQYLYTSKKLYSINDEDTRIFKHNVPYEYQQYKDRQFPFIIEYVDPGRSPIITSTSESITYISDAKQYDTETNEWIDVDKTFTQAILYNHRQCSGNLDLIIKDQESKVDYISQQVISRQPSAEALVERHERNWYINGFRDMSIKGVPIWNYNFDYANDYLEADVHKELYIDKQLNESAINYLKDWTEQEMLRDKFLVVRLSFDDPDSEKTKLLFNYVSQETIISER